MSGNVEKLSVALTPEMMAMVRAAVERGDYASTSEVIRDALRGWGAEQKQREAALAELRALIEEGIDSGPGKYASLDEIKREARKRLGKMEG